MWADILGLLTGVVASTDTLIEVYRDRARLEVRRQIVRAALGLVLLMTAGVWCVAASLSFLRGMVGGFAAWLDGRLWLGELLGGATALGLAAGLLALVMWVRSRREFSQLQAKYRRMRNEPTS
ncbi:MAG: phage holin family protein [Planctomycetes bacterium]|nr:phage holin family protein [Planctomycetota bacterium]